MNSVKPTTKPPNVPAEGYLGWQIVGVDPSSRKGEFGALGLVLGASLGATGLFEWLGARNSLGRAALSPALLAAATVLVLGASIHTLLVKTWGARVVVAAWWALSAGLLAATLGLFFEGQRHLYDAFRLGQRWRFDSLEGPMLLAPLVMAATYLVMVRVPPPSPRRALATALGCVVLGAAFWGIGALSSARTQTPDQWLASQLGRGQRLDPVAVTPLDAHEDPARDDRVAAGHRDLSLDAITVRRVAYRRGSRVLAFRSDQPPRESASDDGYGWAPNAALTVLDLPRLNRVVVFDLAYGRAWPAVCFDRNSGLRDVTGGCGNAALRAELGLPRGWSHLSLIGLALALWGLIRAYFDSRSLARFGSWREGTYVEGGSIVLHDGTQLVAPVGMLLDPGPVTVLSPLPSPSPTGVYRTLEAHNALGPDEVLSGTRARAFQTVSAIRLARWSMAVAGASLAAVAGLVTVALELGPFAR